MKNRFCELMGIEKPIVLAPMIYVCNAELAAAVSNAGGAWNVRNELSCRLSGTQS